MPSGITAVVAVTPTSVTGAYVGTSGFSYPSWRPGFYPREARPEDFLRLYAERLPSVELNVTGYRLPAEEQFDRWAGATPERFRFAVKMPPQALRRIGTFEERVRRLGGRLGPVRLVVAGTRDDGLVPLLAGSTDLPVALDLRDPSWDGAEVAPAVRVNDWDVDAPFRYLRFREPPYSEEQLEELASRIRPLLAAGVEVFAYFRHEDEPAAPAYATRLLELLA